MTRKTAGGQVVNYIYNEEDRLERVEDGTGTPIAFSLSSVMILSKYSITFCAVNGVHSSRTKKAEFLFDTQTPWKLTHEFSQEIRGVK